MIYFTKVRKEGIDGNKKGQSISNKVIEECIGMKAEQGGLGD